MTDDVRDDDGKGADRRAFLEKCGRFSIVTPPVVSLMLAVSSNTEALATSAKTLTTTDTLTTSVTTTTTKGSVTKTVTVTGTPNTSVMLRMDPTETAESRLAMMIDSMGVMKS